VKMKTGFTLAYLVAPWPLWYLVFNVTGENFIYAMAVASSFLAILTMYVRDRLVWTRGGWAKAIGYGIVSTVALYVAFLLGDRAASLIGLGRGVESVYSMIRSTHTVILPVLLAWIGLCEEIYWRGGLQEGLLSGFKIPWLVSSVPYSLVHVLTFNPILVPAAWIVGVIVGFSAYRAGLASSVIAHIAWLEVIVVIAPTR